MTWFKDDQPIFTYGDSVRFSINNNNVGILTTLSASLSSRGNYTCVVTNAAGSYSMSTVVNVKDNTATNTSTESKL